MQLRFTVFGKGRSYTVQFEHGLKRDDTNSVYLTNQEDEGMGMSELNLFDILDEHFKKEF